MSNGFYAFLGTAEEEDVLRGHKADPVPSRDGEIPRTPQMDDCAAA